MYTGNWITGSSGTTKLRALVSELDKNHLAEINKNSGYNWLSYSPWMSCEDNIAYFKKNPIVTHKNKSKVIDSKPILELISEGLKKGTAPLGNLRIFESNEFYINTESVSTSRDEIESAVELICTISKSFSDRLDCLIDLIIPVDFFGSHRSELGRGLSSHFFRKGIFLQPPRIQKNSKLQMMLNVVHELGHQALITYQNADPIIESNRDTQIFSVIRRTSRPAIRSFHALVVTAYMYEFLIEANKNSRLLNYSSISIALDTIKSELLRYRRLLLEGISSFRRSAVIFSQLGSSILDELELLATAVD